MRNGLGLDDWLSALVEDAGTGAPIITLGRGPGRRDLPRRRGRPGLRQPARLDGRRLRVELRRSDRGGAGGGRSRGARRVRRARATAYRASLADLDAQIRERLDAIPAADRAVVSFHDAFPYFAAAYGLTIVGTVVDAPGQDPSAGAIARPHPRDAREWGEGDLREAQFNDALVQAIAAEAGAIVVNDLYDDTLGDPPADTYAGMMAWNADRVVEAVGGR